MNFDNFDWLVRAIIASFVIPLLSIPIKEWWSKFLTTSGAPALGKVAYRNFLIINSKPIGDFFYKIEKYKQDIWIKNIFFVEGMSIGAIVSVALFIFCFIISEISGFNNFFLFTPFYRYLNYGYKDTDLIISIMTINLFSLIVTMLIIFVFYFILYSKGYIQPKLTEELSLKRSSKYLYYSIWFSMGIIIGFNAITVVFTIWFNDAFIKVLWSSVTGFSNYLFSLSVIIIYLGCIGMSCVCVITLYNNTKIFSILFKQKVTDSYIDDFPHIKLKTNAEYISGKIDDILNDSLMILNDGYAIKAIHWDQITTMEIEKAVLKDKITMQPLPETMRKKPWWRFW